MLAVKGQRYIVAAFFAAAAVAVSWAWQGRAGFNIGDEGYLWYGVQRVLRGEFPIRDFLSYEPGRYYWCAAWMALWGDDGLIALRVAVAVFQVVGLAVGLGLLARDAKLHPAMGVVIMATFLAWMFPRHKIFDITLSILLVAAISGLITRPTALRYAATGLAVGLVAVFGRNHGVYGAFASLAAIAYLALGRGPGPGPVQALALWSAGVVAGFLPVLLMAAFVPGFAAAFAETIRALFEIGTTNLPLPTPWPWGVSWSAARAFDATRETLIGLFFIAVPAFGVGVVAWSLVARRRGRPAEPIVIAAALLSIPYAHFAYSRADAGHLAQGIFPLLIGVFALLIRARAAVGWPLAIALLSASLVVGLPPQPGWRCRDAQCVETNVGSSAMRIEASVARDLAMLKGLVERDGDTQRTFYVAPFWPGAYAAFGRKSPTWEIYPLFPRPAPLQEAEIARLRAARPAFAVILDYALDGREELRFRNSHALVDAYVRENFEPVAGVGPDANYRVYRERGAPR